MLLIVSQGIMGPTPASCPMPAESAVQKILMNDFANECVTDTFFFTYCYVKSKGKQMFNSKY
jgi:hypothetical protein